MRPRVFVIDDSPFICKSLSIVLAAAGFEVEVAHDLSGFDGDVPRRPDLVVMDVVLQEAYGDEIAMLLKEARGFDCPIVLFSALPEAELEQRVLEARIDGYVPKRAGLAAVVARARELLAAPAPAAATPASDAGFELVARQRVRRVVHVFAQPANANVTAIVAEMQALAGDADVAGNADLADRARRCVELATAAGTSAALVEALASLAQRLGDARPPRARKTLVIDDRSDDELLHLLDAAGDVVFEARSLAEARQKLRAAEHDVVVLAATIDGGTGAGLLAAVRTQLPRAALVLVGGDEATAREADAAVPRDVTGAELVARIDAISVAR